MQTYLLALSILIPTIAAMLTIWVVWKLTRFGYHIIVRYRYFRDNGGGSFFNARTIIRYAWDDLWR